jgi:hypothetical protein
VTRRGRFTRMIPTLGEIGEITADIIGCRGGRTLGGDIALDDEARAIHRMIPTRMIHGHEDGHVDGHVGLDDEARAIHRMLPTRVALDESVTRTVSWTVTWTVTWASMMRRGRFTVCFTRMLHGRSSSSTRRYSTRRHLRDSSLDGDRHLRGLYIYTYTYIYIHTHTHTHTFTLRSSLDGDRLFDTIHVHVHATVRVTVH